MTDDERFEQFLREAAADYQAPRGETPRDDMWAAIQRQRGAAAATPRTAASPAAAPVVPIHAVPAQPATRRWMWIGMAATLALGVLIGRYALRTDPSRDVAANAAPSVQNATPTTPSVATPATAPAGATAAASAVIPPHTNNARSEAAMSANRDRVTAAAPSATYSVASARHLQAVQVLLASFAADPADARSDSLVSVWARGLLSNTRLLLDSPAARDPQRARLLQDLEVILVQLVQRAPGGDTEARSAVERSIQKSQIIPRLRSALPASLQSGTE